MDFFNPEHYADPTAYVALSQIERAERFRPLVYICSPFSKVNMGQNVENARKYSRFAVDKHCIPIAPHLLFPQFMNEDTERETALFMGIVLLTKCAELWIFGSVITSGMEVEIAKAVRKGIPIRYFSENLEEQL